MKDEGGLGNKGCLGWFDWGRKKLLEIKAVS